MFGHSVSHSNIKTKRRFNPNVKTKRVYVKEIDKTIKLKLTTRALRNIEKIGAYKYLKQQVAAGFNPKVWVEDKQQEVAARNAKRGYRRVEHVDANGHKSYSITFEPENQNTKKVFLSSIL